MNSKLLVDTIMRKTMVLMAQIATMAGARTPLAHIAGQVFFELTRARDEQGAGRKVAADVFGMALRSYQQKGGTAPRDLTRDPATRLPQNPRLPVLTACQHVPDAGRDGAHGGGDRDSRLIKNRHVR